MCRNHRFPRDRSVHPMASPEGVRAVQGNAWPACPSAASSWGPHGATWSSGSTDRVAAWRVPSIDVRPKREDGPPVVTPSSPHRRSWGQGHSLIRPAATFSRKGRREDPGRSSGMPSSQRGKWEPGPLRQTSPSTGAGNLADHAGSSRLTQRPPPSRLASATRPPCASAISRTSASPSPVPLRLVE